MHITKDGRMYSEADCKAWFARLCKCEHKYGIHYSDESCHHQDAKGHFCSCTKFRLAKRKGVRIAPPTTMAAKENND